MARGHLAKEETTQSPYVLAVGTRCVCKIKRRASTLGLRFTASAFPTRLRTAPIKQGYFMEYLHIANGAKPLPILMRLETANLNQTYCKVNACRLLILTQSKAKPISEFTISLSKYQQVTLYQKGISSSIESLLSLGAYLLPLSIAC